jgi:hypothetical protein
MRISVEITYNESLLLPLTPTMSPTNCSLYPSTLVRRHPDLFLVLEITIRNNAFFIMKGENTVHDSSRSNVNASLICGSSCNSRLHINIQVTIRKRGVSRFRKKFKSQEPHRLYLSATTFTVGVCIYIASQQALPRWTRPSRCTTAVDSFAFSLFSLHPCNYLQPLEAFRSVLTRALLSFSRRFSVGL